MNVISLSSPRAILGGLILASAGLLAGCGGDAEVRVYEEVQISPGAASPMASPHGARPPAMPAATPARQAPVRWKAPEGWAESPGSGMRLASFTVGQSSEGACSIVALSGSAGGLQPNVARWIGQLGLTVPDETALAAFVDAQERFESASGLPVVLVDLVPLTRDQGAGPGSMIAAVVEIGAHTGFVKLTGPMALLEQEKENLRELCRSLQAGS